MCPERLDVIGDRPYPARNRNMDTTVSVEKTLQSGKEIEVLREIMADPCAYMCVTSHKSFHNHYLRCSNYPNLAWTGKSLSLGAISTPEISRTRPVKKEFWFYIVNTYVLSEGGTRDELVKENGTERLYFYFRLNLSFCEYPVINAGRVQCR